MTLRVVLELSKNQKKEPEASAETMSVNLSPCIMPWHSLSPSAYKDGIMSPSPGGPGTGTEALSSPAGGPTAVLGGNAALHALSPTLNPFHTAGVHLGAYLKGGAPSPSPNPANALLANNPDDEAPSFLTCASERSALGLMYKPDMGEDAHSDDDDHDSCENNNCLENGLCNGNDAKENEQHRSQDENGNSLNPNCLTPKKTLTTLETMKASSIDPLHTMDNPTNTSGLDIHPQQSNPLIEPISPTHLSDIASSANGYSNSGLFNGISSNNGFSMQHNGLPNGLCNGYPNVSMSHTNGGSGYSNINGYYSANQGPSYPTGYGGVPLNRSCALSGSPYPTQGMPVGGMSTTSQGSSSSPLGVDLSPPSLSPISPTSFGSSCMYSAWRTSGSSIPAVAAAASGIAGAVSPSPPNQPAPHPHPYLHNGFVSDALGSTQVCWSSKNSDSSMISVFPAHHLISGVFFPSLSWIIS